MMGCRKPIDLWSPDVHPRTRAAWSRHLRRTINNPEELRVRLGRDSLAVAFAATAARRPSHATLRIGGAEVTTGELDRLASLVGGGLRGLGVGPGAAVLLSASNSLDVVVAYLGILRTGAAVVLAGPGDHPAELSRMIEDADASFAVATGAILSGLGEANRTVDIAIGLGTEDHGSADVVLADLMAQGQAIDPALVDPDAPALYAFTSGTTGRPKCTPLSHRNLLASIRGAMWAWRWTQEDVMLHALPLSHQHGLGGLHATLLAGSRAVIMTRFESGSLIEALEREAPSVFLAVPAIYQRLVSELDADGWRAFRSVRLMTSGSAPLPPSLAEEVQARTDRLPLERYGLTETGLDVSTPYDGPNLPGMVGLPLPGVELAVVDEALSPVEDGKPGEILFRGPQVFPGYRNDPEATAAAFIGAWFRTGDIGVVNREGGYLRLVGRTKELIISGGFNVYPREVEQALVALPGVVDAAVVGVPSEAWGEEVVAFVVPAAGTTLDAPSVGSQLEVARFKRPRRVFVVDEIPRDAVGKALRETLAAWADEEP
jgi:malonyl-CoA/methylmalonyl-CoA synthetase